MKKIIIFSLISCFLQLPGRCQVAINSTATPPAASSMLDIAATNKGMLIPRISLLNLTDAASIPSPAQYLIIYNTNAALGLGIYVNAGTSVAPSWNRIGPNGSLAGTTNTIVKFTASNVGGNSLIFDNGTTVAIGTAAPDASVKFQVIGGTNNGIKVTLGSAAALPPASASAIYGESAASAGVLGVSNTNHGVAGYTNSSGSFGVYGLNSAVGGYGILGSAPNGTGVSGSSSDQFGTGVGGNAFGQYGTATAGSADGTNGFGVQGYVSTTTGTAYAIYGSGNNVNAYAGYFAGKVSVTGTLSKGGGSFKIDHPLDPANKYLYHSFVESPDMMNIYNGNIVTDGNGFATITMPDYFDALNKDFRYQLTVIGSFAQAIIKEEIAGNKFVIQTDKPNIKVSWQVTGVRQDKFANAHRIEVEVEKEPEFRGLYLHPLEWGKPASSGIDYKIKKQHPLSLAAK